MISPGIPSTSKKVPDYSIYAIPKVVNDINDCYFYHTMDIPGYGCLEGEWDLRKSANKYLGGVNFGGKRVLEIGTASGFLCFYMENNGADVVAFDLSKEHSLDSVPYTRIQNKMEEENSNRSMIERLNNSFWLSHAAYNSNAKAVYGSVYKIPENIGEFDISTFGCILLHLRDPFLALQNALKLTKETVIVTDVIPKRFSFHLLLSKLGLSDMMFLPQFNKGEPKIGWWFLPPEIIKKFISVLGFEQIEVTYHFSSKFNEKKRLLYTIVGHRTES